MDNSRSEPTVEEILAEAERRQETRKATKVEDSPATQLSPTGRNLVVTADRVIFWFTRHWLAFANLIALLYIGLPLLAPALMYVGAEAPARAIYALYRPLCHQLPFRSFYLFGSQLSYTMEELGHLVGPEALVEHGYIGDVELGFKVALCQRDVAIYGLILLFGLFFALTKRRMRPLPFWAYLVFGLVPIGLDGGLQLLSYAVPALIPSLTLPPLESTPIRRTLTGTLFGLTTAWLSYPILQEAIDEILETLERRFGWKR